MSSSATSKDDVVSELASLSLARGRDPKRAGERLAKMEVADSWEDEDDEDDEDNEDNEDDEKDDRDCRGDEKRATAGSGTETPTAGSESILPSAPSRPTAASAYDGSDVPDWNSSLAPAAGGRRDDKADRRPEKTDAVARRMIAAGLGLKAPKQTEEQRAYQRSVREQEKKRREQEREQERKRREEAERAKAAVWDD
ncbi:hypothetical protein DCS_00384 [Drechmeria coniospora]|uniref:Uncharacterized protein n=1 Tax=Drechmeria coniospora TaxID=98403 RepID=A0A151GQ55_DRECN|nr:hypothetical protein DCS_00384 [Drechmeria coniospora]KYK59254.1 hypothetical protein DCS_00384 [Drechmeria coniospora]